MKRDTQTELAFRRRLAILLLLHTAPRTRAQIEEALARTTDGTFGTCTNCGNVIGEKRLAAVPWTPFCIDCQELQEKGLLG